MLVMSQEDTNELKDAVLDWGQAVLAPKLQTRLKAKAHSDVDNRLDDLANKVARLDVGDTLIWPVSK